MKTFILLCLLSFPAFGDVTVHTVSTHLQTSGLNNINPGVGYDFGSLRLGGIYNSYKKPSLYAVGIIDVTDSFRVGAGVVSGYRFQDGLVVKGDHDSIIPLIAAEYDLTKHVSIVWFGEVLNLELKF